MEHTVNLDTVGWIISFLLAGEGLITGIWTLLNKHIFSRLKKVESQTCAQQKDIDRITTEQRLLMNGLLVLLLWAQTARSSTPLTTLTHFSMPQRTPITVTQI